jgi:hypothetical protein
MVAPAAPGDVADGIRIQSGQSLCGQIRLDCHCPDAVARPFKPALRCLLHQPSGKFSATPRTADFLRHSKELIRRTGLRRKFSPCTERILDMFSGSAGMRPSCDTDSIRVVAVWPQARHKGVENALSRLSSLRAVR